jgi:hypothetical protein
LSVGDVVKCELQFGFALPLLFKRVYLEVGYGDFGPGYGFLPLIPPGHPTEQSVLERYSTFMQPDSDEPTFSWPKGMLQFCHWGCGIYSCIDCTKPEAPVLRADPHTENPNYDMTQEANSFREWLEMWLDGRLTFQMIPSPQK